MLGEKIGEEHGKVTGRRVLPGNDERTFMKMEVSFETETTMYGVSGMNMGTYEMYERGPGQLYGEGQGVIMTMEGDGVIWHGQGVGRMADEAGTMAFAAALVCQTTSTKLAALNGLLVLAEHTVDMQGNVKSAIYEWKA